MKRYSATEVSRRIREIGSEVLQLNQPVVIVKNSKDYLAIVPASWVRERWVGFEVEPLPKLE